MFVTIKIIFLSRTSKTTTVLSKILPVLWNIAICRFLPLSHVNKFTDSSFNSSLWKVSSVMSEHTTW